MSGRSEVSWRVRRVAAVFVCAGLALAGCGDSGHGGGSRSGSGAGAETAPSETAPALASLPDAPDGTLWISPLTNTGFEWLADSTTVPPKAGAYWVGAFSREAGDPTSRVVERDDGEGRVLRLGDGQTVFQKIAADPRWTEHLRVELAVKANAGAALDVVLEDGPGLKTTVRLAPPFDADGITHTAPDPGGWTSVALDLGRRFEAEHGRRPQPRMNLHLSHVALSPGATPASVDVDDVVAAVPGPRVDAAELEATVDELVRWQLETWFLPRSEGGLGLVDPDTGYVNVLSYDVLEGQPGVASKAGAFHTIHRLLIEWLRACKARGDDEESARWAPHLERIVQTMVERNFDPKTRLPRMIWRDSNTPSQDAIVTVGAYVEFLMDAAEVLEDPRLVRASQRTCRAVADSLLALQRQHDQPRDTVKNTWKLERNLLVGEFPNWFGHIPPKLSPQGAIDPPKRFNTAWAIVTQRTFWYHVFRSPAAIMRVHGTDPGPDDLEAVRKVIALYERPWDAHRYQIENDTDDHYGYLCEDLLTILAHSDGQLPEALQLLQKATDFRLARDEAVGETLWVQAARLGTGIAGDNPRAIEGLVNLWELPPEINTESAGSELYREAVLELAANDFKGRQLTNGQFTESFFELWEMVCICFRGNWQGDCRKPPPEGWHGDVGDTFGGPPTNAIDGQVQALRVANAAERPEILSRMGTILHVTESTLRRPFGYAYGLDEAIAQQYELPEKYTHGLSETTAVGVSYALAWARLLPILRSEPK